MALILFLMFLIFMLLLYLKADEITKHPCQVCADRMGKEFTCYQTQGLGEISFKPIINFEEGKC